MISIFSISKNLHPLVASVLHACTRCARQARSSHPTIYHPQNTLTKCAPSCADGSSQCVQLALRAKNEIKATLQISTLYSVARLEFRFGSFSTCSHCLPISLQLSLNGFSVSDFPSLSIWCLFASSSVLLVCVCMSLIFAHDFVLVIACRQPSN